MSHFHLLEQLQRIKAKKRGVKLNNIHQFRPWSTLQLETNSRLGNVVVDLPKQVEQLKVGAYSYIRTGSELLCVSEIGRFCSIGRNVLLGLDPRNHPIDWVSTSAQVSLNYDSGCKPLTIGHDVWIGHNAVVMAGISIGHGAVIGANAVVTKNVEPYQIVVGNPAKKIRLRFTESVVSQLLASQWWDYDIKQLRSINFEDVSNFAEQVSRLSNKAVYKTVLFKNKKVVG